MGGKKAKKKVLTKKTAKKVRGGFESGDTTRFSQPSGSSFAPRSWGVRDTGDK